MTAVFPLCYGDVGTAIMAKVSGCRPCGKCGAPLGTGVKSGSDATKQPGSSYEKLQFQDLRAPKSCQYCFFIKTSAACNLKWT
ncbi:hypothetical protein M5E06_02705 [Azospirillum sp. A1-3]|uniref:hypothetical protein n=1 Tax=unclassified Azospirillum TaxID=2630922 RepID=UPI0011B29332|nr:MULTISPECIES: hypothetical protein [unclassified Azospirillum]MCM8733107.1 hypothetical protein [Azospirillum sp. A1-3]